MSRYAHHNQALEYMKQNWTELKDEIDNSTIIVGDFNTSLSTTRQDQGGNTG
jgi:endonuclease/exonuclease/phosphatase family metal-dependent hydrolase